MAIMVFQKPSDGLIERHAGHVPSSGDTSRGSTSGDAGQTDASYNGRLTEADRRHRTDFAEYARRNSHEGYRDALARLYSEWEGWNREYFGGKLSPPHILLAEPKNPRALGDHSLLSGWGSTNQTRIRPSLLSGTHPDVRPGEQYAEGRLRLVLDILRHESVHQYQFEVRGEPEEGYRGHGPVFRDLCNAIGSKLGLPMVRTAKARGGDKDRPSCADWPIGVRPKGYYLGAYLPNCDEAETGDDPGEAAPEPPKAFADWIAENPRLAALLAHIVDRVTTMLDRFFEEFQVPPIVVDQAVTFIAKSYRHRRRTRAKRPRASPGDMAALPSPD